MMYGRMSLKFIVILKTEVFLMCIIIVLEFLVGLWKSYKKLKKSNLHLSLCISVLSEHIEKEPSSVMLITRSTWATPSFIDPRQS